MYIKTSQVLKLSHQALSHTTFLLISWLCTLYFNQFRSQLSKLNKQNYIDDDRQEKSRELKITTTQHQHPTHQKFLRKFKYKIYCNFVFCWPFLLVILLWVSKININTFFIKKKSFHHMINNASSGNKKKRYITSNNGFFYGPYSPHSTNFVLLSCQFNK